MNECPFCKAKIEDNARFCLYCMTPLADKTLITSSSGRKRWLLPVAISFAAVVAAAVFLIWNSGKSASASVETSVASITEAPIDEEPSSATDSAT